MARLGVWIEGSPNGGVVVHHKFDSSWMVEVNSKQHLDPLLMELKELVLGKMNKSFSQGGMVLLDIKEDCVCLMWMI